MNYSVEWKRKALKIFNKIELNLKKRISKKLDLVCGNPFRYLEHYEGEKLFKLRVGEYRFLIDIDDEKKVLIIEVFDKRPRAYVREEDVDYGED